MAKRFTDNAKWCDPWYRKLSPLNKLAWLYITDNCDAAGVIDLDDELANFQIGCTIDWHDFILAASDRLVAVRARARARLASVTRSC